MNAATRTLTREYELWDEHHAKTTPVCHQCGKKMNALGHRTRQIVTIVGVVTVKRHVYYCRQCRSTYAPLDERLNLRDTQYSKPARQMCVHVGAALPFKEGAGLLSTLTAVKTDPSVIKSFCDAAGERIEKQILTQTRNPAKDSPPTQPPHDLLYISVDGANAPIRNGERPWQEVRVGVVFTTQEKDDELRVASREECAYLGKMDDFAPRLWEVAAAHGACRAKQMVFISDGALANWSLADMYFPGARQILDFYHASEHLHTISQCFYPSDDPCATQWYERQRRHLLHGRWRTVMKAVDDGTPLPSCIDVLRRERQYFRKNRHRMHYLHYRRLGLYIGSGVVESACKQIVQRRLRVSGARWNPSTCQGMLNLRCAYLSRKDILEHAA